MDQQSGLTPPAEQPALRQFIVDLQDRIAAAFGIRPDDREVTVRGMLERSGREAAGYWLQLLLAMGIASLGLALGSTAVIIGAMLISPLMGPIVELGMGLAIGSPFLVLRAAARTGASIAVVVTSATLLTSALPFSEVTGEIAARTAPTALDLVVAIFCAIAAAYATVRPGSETASTSAGTAIGIALVPPLCVVGFGLGVRSREIAGGAALLFTANLCAILLFAVLCFLLLGYGLVSIAKLEHEELAREKKGAIRRVARALEYVFDTRYGGALRVLMPLLLLGAVYLPLQEALTQVSWQVRVRGEIEKMIDALPHGAVRSSVVVDRQGVAVRLVTVGRADEAQAIERDLRERIAAAAGMMPRVEVTAVPDAATLQELAAAVKAPAPPLEVVRKVPDAALLRAQIARALAEAWPEQGGALLDWRIRLPEGKPMELQVVHAGAELGAAGVEMLGRALSRDLGQEVAVRDAAIATAPISAAPEAGIGWLPAALRAIERLDEAEALHACVEVPAAGEAGEAAEKAENGARNGGARKQEKAAAAALAREVAAVTAALRAAQAERGTRVQIREGAQWEVGLATAPCAAPAAAGAGAGATAPAP